MFITATLSIDFQYDTKDSYNCLTEVLSKVSNNMKQRQQTTKRNLEASAKFDDCRDLNEINIHRNKLINSQNQSGQHIFKLPDSAAEPYLKPLVTTVAQLQKVVERDDHYIPHSSNTCKMQGGLTCRDCHNRRTKQTDTIQCQSTFSLPRLDSRSLGGIKQLLNMTRQSDNFRPVLPGYHHMNSEEKMTYYCPWTRVLRKSIELPIITQYEQLRRIKKNKFGSETVVNNRDNLPVIVDGRCSSVFFKTPANTEMHTPCPPDDYMPQPPVVGLWRQC
ncbi:hypothetical protein EB796_022851 [Bugula neritina]|uniref:Uncharacterized protein n=1 Tax=Bugula neritina TaxID=10212 RepID=A0A7J7IYF1_BUGNE|nr:hypothetical protein EB796_022851 [Bugula neritina]